MTGVCCTFAFCRSLICFFFKLILLDFYISTALSLTYNFLMMATNEKPRHLDIPEKITPDKVLKTRTAPSKPSTPTMVSAAFCSTCYLGHGVVTCRKGEDG